MSGTTRVRVALVGCGRIAHVHCAYLRPLPQVELAGACDRNESARAALTARWQVPTYADVDELFSATQPDVVHVLTPPATHAAVACDLLRRGVHVLIEKPMAMSTAEADTVLATAQRAGRFVTVDHNRWFDPVVRRAVGLLDAGALGRLVGVDVVLGAAADTGEQGLDWKASLPGGGLYDVAPHAVYMLCGFAGPVRALHVVAQRASDTRLVEVRMAAACERALATVAMTVQTRPFTNRVTVFGSAATAEVNLNNMTLVVRRTRKVPKLVGKVLPNLDEAAQLLRATVVNGVEFLRGRQRFYPGMGVHLQALYEALSRGEPPPVGADEAREPVRVVEEIWRQAGVPPPAALGATGGACTPL